MDKYVREAVKKAKTSCMEQSHGAVIFATKGSMRGQILSASCNIRTIPVGRVKIKREKVCLVGK